MSEDDNEKKKKGKALGEALRDAGIELVSDNNSEWMDNALNVVARNAPLDRVFMADEFRGYPDIGQPNHSGAWGALTRTCASRGLIEFAGRYATSSRPANHAHVYKVWRRVI